MGIWTWRVTLSASGGAVAFLDNNLIWEQHSAVIGPTDFQVGRLEQGRHVLQVYGFEPSGDVEKGGMSFMRMGEPDVWIPMMFHVWPELVCKADCTDYGGGFAGGVDFWIQPKPNPPSIGQSISFSKEVGHVYAVSATWSRTHSKYALSNGCPAGRHGHSTAFFNGKLYMFGGVRNSPVLLSEYLNDLWVFEVASMTWFDYGGISQVRKDGPYPRAGACLGVETAMGDVILTMGYGLKGSVPPMPTPEKPKDPSEAKPVEVSGNL
jgi:hypothetical protein